jgi:hypothetical protein
MDDQHRPPLIETRFLSDVDWTTVRDPLRVAKGVLLGVAIGLAIWLAGFAVAALWETI